MADSPHRGSDPIDTLLAKTGGASASAINRGMDVHTHNKRLLDFVRHKFRSIEKEKKELEEKVKDMEHSLEIIQTAQAWSLGNSMSHEQAAKVKEVTSLLLQAKKAKQDALNFSKVGKGALFEKLRVKEKSALIKIIRL